MAKTSQLTGTGKKNLKKQQKALGQLSELAAKEAKNQSRYKKSALQDIKRIEKGRHVPEYEGKTKFEPFKYKPETEYNPSKFKPKTEYDRQTLSDLNKDFERAGRGAEQIYAPIKKQTLAEFHQNVLPGINNELGSGAKSSSALNQAIGAAGGNLQRGLASDFASLQTNLAQNLLGERENQRRFGAQFGAGQENFYNQLRNQQQQFGAQFGTQNEQFGAQLRNQQNQFGAQFGVGQEQNIYNSQLQALQSRLQANQLLLGQPINQGFSPLQSSYNQKAQGGDSGLSSGLGGLGQGAGSAYAAWQLAKLTAAPPTGGASLAVPV